jgi:hybrid cluster-associated redox disulfide protein
VADGIDIDRDTVIRDVLISCPSTSEVFQHRGLPCPTCLAADMETLSTVAIVHGVDLDDLIAELRTFRAAAERRGDQDHE